MSRPSASTLSRKRRRDGTDCRLPQTFRAELQGVPVATYRQRFNPFVQKIEIDFSADPDGRLDRRLGLAAAVLLCAVEGRQT